jgi:hypothetical protein
MPFRFVSFANNAEIIRSRDPAVLDTCDILVDVGATYEPEKYVTAMTLYPIYPVRIDKGNLPGLLIFFRVCICWHCQMILLTVRALKKAQCPRPKQIGGNVGTDMREWCWPLAREWFRCNNAPNSRSRTNQEPI